MIEISTTPIIRSIKVFDTDKGQSISGRTRYECEMLLTDLACGECRLHSVNGKLTNEINEQVIALCKDLGYRRIQFEVPAGTNASRHAKFQYSHDGLDRYVIELTER